MNNVDIHLTHDVVIVKGAFGPHRAKIHCTKCNKFVAWCHEEDAKWFDKEHNKPTTLAEVIKSKPYKKKWTK